MKTRYKLIFVIMLLSTFLSDSNAQRFYYFPDGKGGYFNLKVIDSSTNNVRDSLPAIFSSVDWDRKSGDDFVVAGLGFSASFVLDTSLTTRAVFPYNSRHRGFVNGICLFEYQWGIGALDVNGNIVIEPEYDYIFYSDDGLVALKRLARLSDNCFEALKVSYDGDTRQSFSIFMIDDEKITTEYAIGDGGAFYRSFTSEELIEEEYAGDSLIVDRTLAYGLHHMYECNFKDARDCFYECIASGASDEVLIEAAKYNILVCDMMMSGEPVPFLTEDSLGRYQIYAALNGIYGSYMQDMFASFYELPMIVRSARSEGRKVLPYKEYADKVFCCKAGLDPLSDGIDGLKVELQTLKENFLLPEFNESVRCDVSDGAFDTMIVSFSADDGVSFIYKTDKSVPDDVFRKSYYIDVFRFVLSVAEKYGFDTLMMTFPY